MKNNIINELVSYISEKQYEILSERNFDGEALKWF